jgi:TolB-like protein/Tfp pilus assembly protein PilF
VDLLSRIAGWLGENEATISAVVGIAVLAGIVFAGVRSLVRRRGETAQERAAGAAAEPASATDFSPPDLDPLTVPGFEGRPAIAVLPFDNLSGDPEQEYFADGIAEDLITRLSAWRWFPVIARNSSFTYKGRAVDVKQVGRELGVRYVVEGSVRRSKDRVRIAAQLIDATTGHHLWAETYDQELRDIFDIQDEIAEAIARSVEPTLERSEWKRTLRQEPQELDAWDSYSRGWWHVRQSSKDENAKARLLFERAIELDPNFAWAFAALAMVHGEDVTNQWSESADQSVLQAEQAVHRAIALASDDSAVQYALAYVCRLTGQLGRAVEAYERVLRLDPSFAHAFYHLGVTLAMTGKPDQAIENIEMAMRLSPKDQWFHLFLFGMSMAHSVAGRYEESLHWAQQSLQLNTGFMATYLVLAASYATLGRLDEAQTTVHELLRLNPAFSLSGFKAVISGWDPDLAAPQGRAAGVS